MKAYKAKNWKFIIFGLNKTNTQIEVLNILGEDDYETFLAALPEDDCRFAVYDCEYDSGEGMRNRRVFYTWCVPNRLL